MTATSVALISRYRRTPWACVVCEKPAVFLFAAHFPACQAHAGDVLAAAFEDAWDGFAPITVSPIGDRVLGGAW